MKGSEKLIQTLNSLLAEELTGINQYIVHAEMCEDWGFTKLSEATKNRAIVEMRHAEMLIERILFLEGRPIVSRLEKITIGSAIPTQIANDLALEIEAVEHYNDAIALAAQEKDHATREILVAILQDEDEHLDALEELQDQIDHMGLEVFLSTQN